MYCWVNINKSDKISENMVRLIVAATLTLAIYFQEHRFFFNNIKHEIKYQLEVVPMIEILLHFCFPHFYLCFALINCRGKLFAIRGRSQEEVGRQFKNVNFYKVETVNEGDRQSKELRQFSIYKMHSNFNLEFQ